MAPFMIGFWLNIAAMSAAFAWWWLTASAAVEVVDDGKLCPVVRPDAISLQHARVKWEPC